jgi:hypothetical protein
MSIPGRLATPSKTTTKTTDTLYAEMLSGVRLNLCPTYQRARCWKQWQNNGFIDSIMRNYPTPLITLYTLRSDAADAAAYAAGVRFECVDGQNRLCAINAFRSGTQIINDRGVPETVFWETPAGRKHYRDLSPEEQECFNGYDFAVTIIQEPMTLDQRKAMFIRLQDGTRISRPEYMRNTEHPVSKFICRTDMRDKTIAVTNGYMLAGGPRGEWIVMLADCITLFLNRSGTDLLEVLGRDWGTVRRILECKEEAAPRTKYDMSVTTPDDAPLMYLFNALLSILEAAKADKVKYHRFHVVVLFHQLLTGAPVPSTDRLRTWFKTHKIVNAKTKEGEPSPAIYRWLIEQLSAEPIAPVAKPVRAHFSKSARRSVWGRHFGGVTCGACVCCEVPIGILEFAMAHIHSVASGGSNDLSNIVPTCVGCNEACSDMNLREWCGRMHPAAAWLRSA